MNGPNLAGVRYQMTVTNTSTLATAYNVVISQDIPAGLTLDPNTGLCNAAFVTPPATAAVPTPVTCTAVPAGSGANPGFHLHASAIGPLQPGQQIVFSYTIDVVPGFFPAAIALPPTAATVDWTSQSGPPVSLTSNGPPGPAGSTYAKQRTGKTQSTAHRVPGADRQRRQLRDARLERRDPDAGGPEPGGTEPGIRSGRQRGHHERHRHAP